ncbi:response regulator [Chthoniobacter sp.]|uniref:response regulator n=1 Tax=Chthoniobacter sp. TaxID=2510640 RepID=UPI0032AF2233
MLLLLAGTAFVAGLVALRRTEAQKFAGAKAALESAWRARVEEFWGNQGASLQKMVEEYSGRPNVLEAIVSDNRKWAEDTWDDRTLAGFSASAVWVYHGEGTLFYSHSNTQPEELQKTPLSADALAKLFGRDKVTQFYFPLAPSVTGGLRLMEVRGVSIRSSLDRTRQSPVEAFFLAGRIWDEDQLRLAFLDNDRAHLLSPEKAAATVFGASEMHDVVPLRDWQGRDLAHLVFTKVDPQMAALDARGDNVFFTLLLGALVLFVVLFLLLHRAVVRPLQRVIESLHTENVKPLEPLRGQKAEFGELARLIKTFFVQRADLMREMNERSAAEKALHESEEMLRHLQKMEAVGRLAGGVAHDFNNLLTAIIGYADLLRQRFGDNPAARQPAELIHQAGEQAAGLTRQLLAFSRKQLLQPKIIDLNAIITNLHRLLQRIIGEHIEIVSQPEAAQPRVKADPGQIEQVIVNLGVNARDAMPGGGRLTIRTCNLVVSEARPVPELEAGEYVALEVTDTGEGMDAETKGRIFEPFFTTKGPGKGTGLGLATVYGIVRQSHGAIVVESECGRGSTFRIYLPMEQGAVETVALAPIPANGAARKELILVVEDEDIVRDLVCEILQSQGYRVLATNRGSEAVRLLREEEHNVDLLISDVVMPEMNGARVAQHVHELCPRARVLFVSGYSENDMADQGLEALAFQVLQKPFTPGTLTRKVRAVLDAPSA